VHATLRGRMKRIAGRKAKGCIAVPANKGSLEDCGSQAGLLAGMGLCSFFADGSLALRVFLDALGCPIAKLRGHMRQILDCRLGFWQERNSVLPLWKDVLL